MFCKKRLIVPDSMNDVGGEVAGVEGCREGVEGVEGAEVSSVTLQKSRLVFWETFEIFLRDTLILE